MSNDVEDICWCGSCRRVTMPQDLLERFVWVGKCSCMGNDMTCFSNPDNWRVTCPDCGVECSGESAPSIDGTGYGHVVWRCNWLPCGWWWG